jgi:hypothetical protein
MFYPSTDLGKIFSIECQKLNDYFKDSSKQKVTSSEQIKVSHAVHDFFKAIQELPAKLLNLDYSLTVLFEIDQAVIGSYGASVFKGGELTSIRKLLRDIIALWYRYELLAHLERKNPSYLNVVGVRSYYEEWLKTEHVGIEESEYDRILGDMAILLENNDNLEVQTRILLFSMLGNILITLGVSASDAERTLSNYKDEIKNRVDLSLITYAEVLLNLQVLYSTSIQFERLTSINYDDLNKAIRYWSSTDTFSENLFKSWQLYWENDYSSPVTKDEEAFLIKDRHSLYSLYNNPLAKIGIGHSFVEFTEHKRRNPSLTSIFKPAPIFVFGNSGVGKSSFLTAFCYDTQMKLSKSDYNSRLITLSRELQAHYQNTHDEWQKGSVSPTSGYCDYAFWEDLNVNSYMITDYGGKDTQPDQWEPKLQELFRSARALLFFIDDKDYTDPYALRRRASLFDSFLQYWMQSNPQIRHIPIALILTKCDLTFGETLSSIPRTSLFPLNLQPIHIETEIPNKIWNKKTNDMSSPYGRFRDALINDRTNNQNPKLQDVVQILLDNFAQFFSRVLDLTYNYQVFLTSAAPPANSADKLLPYGIREPIDWITTIFDKIHLSETLNNFTLEETTINSDIEQIKNEVIKMYQLRDRIEDLEGEIKYLQESSNVFTVITRDLKIKGLKHSLENSNSELEKILKRYIEKPDTQNRTAMIKSIENQIQDKEELQRALRDRKRDLENRGKRY